MWAYNSKAWDKEAENPGRFVTCMPQWVYRSLQYNTEREGVSMNALIVSILARELGKLPASRESKQA